MLAFPISTKIAVADDSYKTNDLQAQYLAYQEAQEWSVELTTYSATLVNKRTGQCVMALRKYFSVPYSEVHGAARTTIPNSSTPAIGAVIILKMSSLGHVGIVIAINDNQIIYFDSNGDWRQRGAIRSININDPRIKGFRIINYE